MLCYVICPFLMNRNETIAFLAKGFGRGVLLMLIQLLMIGLCFCFTVWSVQQAGRLGWGPFAPGGTFAKGGPFSAAGRQAAADAVAAAADAAAAAAAAGGRRQGQRGQRRGGRGVQRMGSFSFIVLCRKSSGFWRRKTPQEVVVC